MLPILRILNQPHTRPLMHTNLMKRETNEQIAFDWLGECGAFDSQRAHIDVNVLYKCFI